MIVQLLIGDGGKLELSQLPEDMQMLLAREVGAIKLIDRDTVNAVASEFVRDLGAVGLMSPGGADGAIEALSEHLSPNLANRLRAERANAKGTDPWAVVLAISDDAMVDLMNRQSVEIGAVTLSKLPVGRAADILGRLAGPQARRITYTISQTEKIPPEAVLRIGTGLIKDHCGVDPVAFEKAPDARVGAILNSSPATTRDSLLEGLGDDDPAFADSVRKSIFTFKDIPLRLTPTDIPTCIRGVSPEELATAIAGALAGDAEMQEAAEFILSNISQRMSAQIREEAQEQGPIKPKVAEEAMRALSSAIRALVDDGTIQMIVEDEDDDMDTD